MQSGRGPVLMRLMSSPAQPIKKSLCYSAKPYSIQICYFLGGQPAAGPAPGTPNAQSETPTSSTDANSRQQPNPQMPPFGTMFPPFFCPPPFFGMCKYFEHDYFLKNSNFCNFIFIFSVPPPPMPPSDFTGLSDEELRRMEGNARENIEARLQCLRQIELLLDASVTVMQQYMTTVTATNM